MWIACIAQLILALDVTIILVANVRIGQDLGFAQGKLFWLVSAYSLPFGGLLLLCGRLIDAFGHRRMFLTGLCTFGLASLAAAVSTLPGELVAARALQGLGASMVSPAALALLTSQFRDVHSRRRALALWSAAGSAGGVLGFTVGGVLVGYLGWRWAFLINVPLAVVAVTVGSIFLPTPSATEPTAVPIVGGITITTGVGLALYALGAGQADGWANAATLASSTVSGVLIAAFIIHESRSANPLIPAYVIRRRESVADVAACLVAATVGAGVFLGSLLLQEGFGYRPEQLGFLTLPVPIGVAIGAIVATRLVRSGMRSHWLPVAGPAMMAASLIWSGLHATEHDYVAATLPAWAVFGFSLAITQIPLIAIATSGATDSDRGSLAGVYNMCQQVGTAVGLAAITAIAVANGSGSLLRAIRIHGLQTGLLATAGFGLLTTLLIATALPRSEPTLTSLPQIDVEL